MRYILQLSQHLEMQESISFKVKRISEERQIYKIGGIIGVGAFGTVFKGYDKQNGRIVALKYVENSHEQTWRKQIKALQMFDHPNIVKYFFYIPVYIPNTESLKGVYIVTEFVRGQNLEEYIGSAEKVGEKGLSQEMVLKLFTQLLEGFDHIHSKGFVHRDIKPENILIDENQNVKIIDLGQSKQRILLKTKGLGTPLYSAPETFQSSIPADFRRDIWSLGLVLYQMITGKCYFEEWKECKDQNKFIKHLETCKIKVKYPLNFDPFWTEITKKMLVKNYNLRINLHQIIFQLKNKQHFFQQKFHLSSSKQPIPKSLTLSAISGNTNPLTQSQNQFQFSRIKKYFKFFKNKHKLLVLLVNMLSKYKYPFLSNSHKLILVFISLNIYISSIQHLLKRLQKNKITITQNEKFNVLQFEEPYKTATIQTIAAYREYYEKESKFAKNTILERIIPKFSENSYKTQSSEADSLDSGSTKPIYPWQLLGQYSNVKKLMADFKQGTNYTKGSNIQIFNEVIFSEDYHQAEQNMRNYFYEEDLSIYYLFMIIGNLDKMLSWGHDYLGNQIPKLMEQLQNLKKNQEQRQSILSKIAKYNYKTNQN